MTTAGLRILSGSFTAVVCFYLFSCKPKYYLTPEQSPLRLQFEKGGGFAGGSESVFLAGNGQMWYQIFPDTQFYPLSPNGKKHLPKKLVKKWFKKADDIFASAKEIPAEPDNFYRSVFYTRNDKTVWFLWYQRNERSLMADSLFNMVWRYHSGFTR
ncbi:MAG: hypothetical protein JNK73_02550 [Bacteroidia bacterium]|nr:hypothetical protein [Bacteroidia bacterium]